MLDIELCQYDVSHVWQTIPVKLQKPRKAFLLSALCFDCTCFQCIEVSMTCHTAIETGAKQNLTVALTNGTFAKFISTNSPVFCSSMFFHVLPFVFLICSGCQVQKEFLPIQCWILRHVSQSTSSASSSGKSKKAPPPFAVKKYCGGSLFMSDMTFCSDMLWQGNSWKFRREPRWTKLMLTRRTFFGNSIFMSRMLFFQICVEKMGFAMFCIWFCCHHMFALEVNRPGDICWDVTHAPVLYIVRALMSVV